MVVDVVLLAVDDVASAADPWVLVTAGSDDAGSSVVIVGGGVGLVGTGAARSPEQEASTDATTTDAAITQACERRVRRGETTSP